MQETRQHILEILKARGQATVEEIVADLRARRGEITAVTVRHHLTRLQESNLITAPRLRYRNAPGRPQHIYALTEKAAEYFPNNYQQLTQHLLAQIQAACPPSRRQRDSRKVLAETMAGEMVDFDTLPFDERIKGVLDYLNERGYKAYTEQTEGGVILHTSNCPYHEVAQHTEDLCNLDMRLIATLIGVVPRRIARIAEGDTTCAYLIPSCQQEVTP
ncbi:hypothetical protein HC928_21170 [bacterium]|nr:hypothetical protein [bacterium]